MMRVGLEPPPGAARISTGELEQLYLKYGMFLHRRARLILRCDALAQDALQEAFVKILRSTTPLSEIRLPLRWLYRIVDRTALDLLRRRKSAPQLRETEFEPELATPHPAVQAEERDFALRFLADLDDESQQIALCAFVDGMNQGEIAEELGYSRVTINKRIGALRERARECAGERAGEQAHRHSSPHATAKALSS
jgi:RNA polymerase sigma-70 factor, ECF subfamily